MKRIVKNIGGSYTPPAVKESPVLEFGVATIKLVEALTDKARRDFRTAFENCCRQKKVHLSLVIRGYAITIGRATHKVLWDVLQWLGMEKPQPKASPAPSKKPPVMMKAARRPRAHHLPSGPRFAKR